MKRLILACCIALVSTSLFGQDAFRPDGRYDAGIPRQAKVLGFSPGERPVRYAQLVRYCEALARASDRVTLQKYGKTHEGRDLILLIISDKDNLSRLDQIREAIGTLADPRVRPDSGEPAGLIERTPAVAYMAYTIHGDEFSGSDAALRLAYELAAGTTPDVDTIRKELVVLMDPLQNPDGRERILAMNAAFMGAEPNPDPEALSHEGFWPWGRGNHYLFDLNRDWFAQAHPETRGRAGVLRTWHPQLVVDSHEMGSDDTYLFNPPRAPFNPNLPGHTLSWWQRFSADQARAFDREGWSYYTRDWNEEFFPGYGSAINLYQGAIGILHEQAGTGGQPVRKPHGAVLTYQQSVARQFVSSLTNLRTAAENRKELLSSYRAARAEAIERGAKGTVRAFYFTGQKEPHRAARLASGLAGLGIEVERLPKAITLSGARTFWKDGIVDAKLPEGSYRVRLDQPDGLLAKVVLEPHTPMPDSFLAEEREHQERQKGTRVYDVTAWSFLLASGLDAFWSSRLDTARWEPVDEVAVPPGRVLPGEGGYGWIFDGSQDAALALAADLVSSGYKIRVGMKPVELGGRAFSRGSFLLRKEENPEDVHDALARIAAKRGVEVAPTRTALASQGPDLGSEQWTLLETPRIAILAGTPLNTSSVGAAWHLLDKELGLRVSLIDASRLSRIDLARYNVLVLPGAWGGGASLQRVLGAAERTAIAGWVQAGGTLVGLAGGAESLAWKDSDLSAVRRRQDVLNRFPAPRFGLDALSVRALERLQGTGLGPDGLAVSNAGPYTEQKWPSQLGIPGKGSPLLGPGLWAMLGSAGDAARKRFPLSPADGVEKNGAATTKEAGGPEEKAEAELREDKRLRRFMPGGAILRVDLDEEHWLAFGAGDKVAVMARQRYALIAQDPVRTVGRFAAPEQVHLGGLFWPEAAGRICRTAWLTREGKGKGQVILFAGEPNFRGYFWGTERLFLNAVLLGPGAGTTRTLPW